MVDDPQIDDPTTFSQWEPESLPARDAARQVGDSDPPLGHGDRGR